MRVAVLGAGGIGGAIGARLFEAGHSVVLIARGEHGDAIRRDGLALETPEGTTVFPVPCVAEPADVDWRDDDVVLLAAQSQHTAGAPRPPVLATEIGARCGFVSQESGGPWPGADGVTTLTVLVQGRRKRPATPCWLRGWRAGMQVSYSRLQDVVRAG